MKKPGNAGGAKARQEGGCVPSMTKQEELSKVEETPKLAGPRARNGAAWKRSCGSNAQRLETGVREPSGRLLCDPSQRPCRLRGLPKNRRVVRDQVIFLPDWPPRTKPVSCALVERTGKCQDPSLDRLVFLTNHLDFGATTIADKERWQIELFFKALKQNLRTIRPKFGSLLILKCISKQPLTGHIRLLRMNPSHRDLWRWLNQESGGPRTGHNGITVDPPSDLTDRRAEAAPSALVSALEQ